MTPPPPEIPPIEHPAAIRLGTYLRECVDVVDHSDDERQQALEDFQTLVTDLDLATAAANDFRGQLYSARESARGKTL